MSEEKVDKRRIVSKERLLAMEKMRQAKAAKAAERKNNVELEPKVEAKPEIPNVPNQLEEEVSEDEIPVPKIKKKMTSPIQPLYGLQDEIQRIVYSVLPPEFSLENRKKKKWEMRKKEIRDEILQSLKPSDTTTEPSKEPQKNAKPALQNIDDLFW